MRVAVATAGRFHADQLAAGLLEADHDTRLYTALPKSRFGDFPRGRITSWLDLTLEERLPLGRRHVREARKIRRFGGRLARAVATAAPDALVVWSSFGYEALQRFSGLRVVVRDSHHIDHVDEVLREEYGRLGIPDAWPDRTFWNERERAEYDVADLLLVPGENVRASMVSRGVDPAKVRVITLAIDLDTFRPPEDVAAQLPLEVMYFGTLSVRKAVPRIIEMARRMSPKVARFTLIGPLEPECERVIRGRVPSHVRILPAMSRAEAAAHLQRGHIYLFPSLEEGYAQTVPQAMACGLAGIVTTATGSVEHVVEGETGFRIAPGDVDAAERALERLAGDLPLLQRLRTNASRVARSRPWSAYRQEVVQAIEQAAAGRSGPV